MVLTIYDSKTNTIKTIYRYKTKVDTSKPLVMPKPKRYSLIERLLGLDLLELLELV